MTVKYFGDIRPLVGGLKGEGWSQRELEVGSLLRALGKRHEPLEKRLWEGNQLSSTIIILVNGRSIDFLKGIETPLRPDDIVDVFPVEAGG
jgi:molybdopterin synthase sulfur carrier subunit